MRSRSGVSLWDAERRRCDLPTLRRAFPNWDALKFPGDGLPGPLPAPGQTWTKRPNRGATPGALYVDGRPVRCRVLSVEHDEHGEYVRIYVGGRWYDSTPGTLRIAVERLRREWFFGRRDGWIECPTPHYPSRVLTQPRTSGGGNA